jgi:hypothetical protein
MARGFHDQIPSFTLRKSQRFVNSTRLSLSQSAATRADIVRLAVYAGGGFYRAYTNCSAYTHRLRLPSLPSSLRAGTAREPDLTVGQKRSLPFWSAPASET